VKEEPWICPLCCWFNEVSHCLKPEDWNGKCYAWNGLENEGCGGTAACIGYVKIEEEEIDGSKRG